MQGNTAHPVSLDAWIRMETIVPSQVSSVEQEWNDNLQDPTQ